MAKYCSRKCKIAARDDRARARRLAGAVQRPCAVCETPLPLAAPSRTRCCSPKCSEIYQNRKRADEKAARKLASRKPCRYCGGQIPDEVRAGAVYCSWDCKHNAHSARWREQSPHYMRLYLYGVTPAEYDAMMARQDNRCAICRTDQWGGRHDKPHTDHDGSCCPAGRACGKCFRGILCANCNNGLGMFGHDPARLRAAAGYLERVLAGHLTG